MKKQTNKIKRTYHLRVIATWWRRTVPRRLGGGVIEVTHVGLCSVSDAAIRRVVWLLLVLLQHGSRTAVTCRRTSRLFGWLRPVACCDGGGGADGPVRRLADHLMGHAGAGGDERTTTAAQPPPFVDALTVTVTERRLQVFRTVILVSRYLTVILSQFLFTETVNFVLQPTASRIYRADNGDVIYTLKHKKENRLSYESVYYTFIRNRW